MNTIDVVACAGRRAAGAGLAVVPMFCILASCVHLPPELEKEFEPAAAGEDNYRPVDG